MRSREREFSELDAASGGDGDLGTAIVAALDAMVSAVGADFKESLERITETLEERVSGSTASLYGSWLEGMAGAVGEGVQELAEEGLAAVFEGGLKEVEAATGARVGDKTLMDALIPATVANLVRAADRGFQLGMPVMGVTAVGRDRVRDARYFALASRVAAENGAAIVKTYYTEGFEKVANSCPVPIVVAGGKKLPELEALELAYRAVDSSAYGVDMGRNVFQSDAPAAMLQAISAVVHDLAKPHEAFELYRSLK